MPYQTGTAASFSALQAEILTFCQNNGLTLEGSALLKKAGTSIFVKFDNDTNYIVVSTGTGSDGSGNLTGSATSRGQAMTDPYMESGAISWPVNYFLHYQASPDQFFFVIEFNNGYHQWMTFGEIEKAMTFTGGLYAAASAPFGSSGAIFNSPDFTWRWEHLVVGNGNAFAMPAPFWGVIAGTSFDQGSIGHHLYATIPGVAGTLYGSYNETTGVEISAGWSVPMRERSLVSHNNSMTLCPFLMFVRPGAQSGNGYYLGRIPQIRYCRIRYYNPGDVITLGADKWKLYPMYLKSSSNNPSSNNHSGDWGIAVAYDGP